MQAGRMIAAICLTGLLAGCASDNPYAFLPQPYKPGDKGSNRTATMVLSDHIVVEPIRGMDSEQSMHLTQHIIAALLEREMIATSSRPAQRTSRLVGETVGGNPSAVLFTLIDPYGRRLQTIEINPAQARQSALEIATRIAPGGTVARVEEPDVTALPPDLAQGVPPIMVTAIFGTTGNGDAVLRAGIRRALLAQGFDLVERPGPEVLQLQANVTLGESVDGFQRLALSWELKSPSGKSLVTIDQANDIPAGTLDQGWDQLANPITQGAASGILQFFQTEAVSRPSSP